jgi:hypothetical protein
MMACTASPTAAGGRRRPTSSPLSCTSSLPVGAGHGGGGVAAAASAAPAPSGPQQQQQQQQHLCEFLARSPVPHTPPRSRGLPVTVLLAICDTQRDGIERQQCCGGAGATSGDPSGGPVSVAASAHDMDRASPPVTVISDEDKQLVLHASAHTLTLNTSYADTKKFRFTKVRVCEQQARA